MKTWLVSLLIGTLLLIEGLSVAAFAATADFVGQPGTWNAPSTVTFTDKSSNNVTSWQWNFGDGTQTTVRNPVHVYDTPGRYSVTLTVTAPDGSDTKTGNITVEPFVPSGNEYLVTVDPSSHKKFGLFYPVTYKFRLPPGSQNLTAQYRYWQGTWKPLPEKRRSDLFNGLDAVRFDYANGFAYVSARFSSVSDNLYLRVIDAAGDPVTLDFDSIPKYYDDRSAAVSVVLDDWNILFDHYFDIATHYLYADNLYFSVAVIAADTNWPSIQQHIDEYGDQMEVASHTLHHACTADMYAASGYQAETAGSRDAIIANLNFDNYPYVPLFVEPCGYSDSSLQQAVSAANYLVERCSNNFFNTGANFIPWDATQGRYGRAAETFDDGAAGDSAALLSDGDAAFDKVMAMGGIYTLVDHPSRGYWYDNSYLLQHLDYVKGRSNVWYVPLGQLYQYHFLQEMRGNLQVRHLGSASVKASFSATPLSGTSPLTVRFTDTSTGTITSWNWSFGDSGVSTAQNPFHTFSAAGTYAVKLTVTGPDGSDTLLRSGYIAVNPATPPTVRLTAPASGAAFNAPASIALTATAAGGSGASVRKVDFYSGNTLIGTAATAPYSFTWSNVAAGSYSLSAKVTDSDGAVATSTAVVVSVAAVALPAPWLTTDVGNVGLAGSASAVNGIFTLKGSGSDIYGTADAFRFVYKEMTGDGQVVAKVVSLQNTDPHAKAGVMMRQSLTAGSIHAMTDVTSLNGGEFLSRIANGGNTIAMAKTRVAAPYWVKLVRAGNVFTGYVSADGVTWVQVGTRTITMNGTIYAGVAVSSHDNTTLCTATMDSRVMMDKIPPVVTAFSVPAIYNSLTVPIKAFIATDNVGVTGYLITESPIKPLATDPRWSTNLAATSSASSTGQVAPVAAPGATPPADPLPAPWLTQDIGSVAAAGSAKFLNGTFTMTASGPDATATADAYRFVYKAVAGDGEITARVASLDTGCTGMRGGVAIRGSLAAGAATAVMAISTGGAEFSSRVGDGAAATVSSTPGYPIPYWVRLVRSGDVITGYVSMDGANWESMGRSTISMTDPVYLGLMVTGPVVGAVCTATFDGVK